MLQILPAAVGHALRGQRAGLEKLAVNKLGTPGAGIDVTSPAFADHAFLPERCTADGEGRSPPLQWSGLPAATASVVLLVEDADSPTPQPLVHAIVVDLPAQDGGLAEGALSPTEGDATLAGRMGQNSLLRSRWLPPDPPPGHGAHRYAFQVFALNCRPDWSAEPGRDEVLKALEAGAIASGCCIGLYQRGSIPVDPLAPAAVAA